MEHEIELQIMPSGNIAVYRGNGFIPTEQLTEEEKEFIIDRIADELGVNTKGDRETFAEHYGCLPEPEYTEEEVISTTQTIMPSLKPVVKSFIDFLDKNRREGKMCLSNGECEDIEKAFREQDWEKLGRYIRKYIGPEEND